MFKIRFGSKIKKITNYAIGVKEVSEIISLWLREFYRMDVGVRLGWSFVLNLIFLRVESNLFRRNKEPKNKLSYGEKSQDGAFSILVEWTD